MIYLERVMGLKINWYWRVKWGSGDVLGKGLGSVNVAGDKCCGSRLRLSWVWSSSLAAKILWEEKMVM